VNAVRIETPAKAIGPGDVLTIALERDVKVLRVLANGERRGPYSEARLLYEEIGGPTAVSPASDGPKI
jgi:ribosome-associated heat shock protein Hsp15